MSKRFHSTPPHEEIACCAYLIYESRGRGPGRDLEDWLEAEAQLIADRKLADESREGKISNERKAPWENVLPAETTTTSHSKL